MNVSPSLPAPTIVSAAAEAEHEGVERGVLSIPQVHRVRRDQPPARTRVPRVLRQGFQPDAGGKQIPPIGREQEREPEFSARQRDGAHGEDDHQHEQGRNQDARRLFNAAHAEGDDRHTEGHGDAVGENRCTRPRVSFPERHRRLGRRHRNAARQRSPQVADRPPHHHRVVEHDRGGREGDPRPHPGAAPSEQAGERTDRPAARFPAHGEFHQDQRNGPQEEEHGPGEQERAAPVGGRDAGEPPDIAGSNGHAEHDEHGSPARGEALILGHSPTSLSSHPSSRALKLPGIDRCEQCPVPATSSYRAPGTRDAISREQAGGT